MKTIAITENHLFQKVYAKGKHVATPTVVVYCLKDKASNRLQKANPLKQKVNRLGLTTTKKLGNAVKRSRVRRILREAYRRAESERPIRKGNLIVLVARSAALSAKMQTVYADLVFAFSKMDLYDPAPDRSVEAEKSPKENLT